MVKGNGHSRTYTLDTQQFSDRKAEYITKLASGEFDTNKSYFSEISGGNVLYMKDRRYKEDEMQAAKALADDANIVTMTPEEGEMYAIHIKDKTLYPDGKILASTYEQRTPKPEGVNFVNNVKNAIEHAKTKGADIALIYDRYGSFHRNHIEDGIKEYVNKNARSKHQTVIEVIVVNSKGEVYYRNVEN
ncbi:MAG: hypothetical protein MJZ99_00835 [Bacteroidales bacterium]|nr:hypothetical protein [Bacteroidales bacterium]